MRSSLPPQANAAFVHNMEDVLEVYRQPPDDRCPVVCVDESSKQLVSETRVPQPAAPGQPVRHDYEYRRHGVRNLFLLTAPKQGWRTVKVTARRTKLDFAAVLRDLTDLHFPRAGKVVLVCDNLNTHHPSVLYESFPPAEARRIAARLEWRYTPRHGSRPASPKSSSRPWPRSAWTGASRARPSCGPRSRPGCAPATPWAGPCTGSSQPRTPAPNFDTFTPHLNEVALLGLKVSRSHPTLLQHDRGYWQAQVHRQVRFATLTLRDQPIDFGHRDQRPR